MKVLFEIYVCEYNRFTFICVQCCFRSTKHYFRFLLQMCNDALEQQRFKRKLEITDMQRTCSKICKTCPIGCRKMLLFLFLHVINISLTVKKNKLTFLAYVCLVVLLKMKESHLHGFEVWAFKTVLHS